ncbi:MAG TPA: hypothetical protein PK920_12990, partial [Phycisphaerae bacterium]|nr:hypothetical protein [Phycisphaerae bacterium]
MAVAAEVIGAGRIHGDKQDIAIGGTAGELVGGGRLFGAAYAKGQRNGGYEQEKAGQQHPEILVGTE